MRYIIPHMARRAVVQPSSSDWRSRREASGLSLREVARRASINPAILSMIETRRMMPTAAEAEAILRVLEDAA